MKPNYAKYAERTAWLFTEYGEKMARRYFGDKTIEALPRYSKGKHKDALKGTIEWVKVTQGGWVRDGESIEEAPNGHVERRVNRVIRVYLTMPEWNKGSKILQEWNIDNNL